MITVDYFQMTVILDYGAIALARELGKEVFFFFLDILVTIVCKLIFNGLIQDCNINEKLINSKFWGD